MSAGFFFLLYRFRRSRLLWSAQLLSGLLLCFPPGAHSQSSALIISNFEEGSQEWLIPDWEKKALDHACTGIRVAGDFVSEGNHALEMTVAFPGRRWVGAYVERNIYINDWSPFKVLALDVYVPYNAPEGLTARVVVTIGKGWTWTEMNRGIPLKPDAWTTILVDMTSKSMDWKFFPNEQFRQDIRRLGVRVEADGLAYSGPIYIDNVRFLE